MDIGTERLGAHDLPPYLQQTFQAGRRVGTDQASSAVQFDPNDRGYVGSHENTTAVNYNLGL